MFESAKTETLTIIGQNLKRSLMEIIDMGDKAFIARKPGASPANEMFLIKMGLLAEIEAEIARRGMNPKHPCFGEDVLGMIERAKAG